MGEYPFGRGAIKAWRNGCRAQAEATILGDHISKEQPNRNGLTPHLNLLKEHVSGKLRPALTVLALAVGVVMLIVCANLSNLLLARSTTRQKELAIRSALGQAEAGSCARFSRKAFCSPSAARSWV